MSNTLCLSVLCPALCHYIQLIRIHTALTVHRDRAASYCCSLSVSIGHFVCTCICPGQKLEKIFKSN